MSFPAVVPDEDMNILRSEWTLAGYEITPLRMKNTKTLYVGEKHRSTTMGYAYSYKWYVTYVTIDGADKWFRDMQIGLSSELSEKLE